MVELSTSQTEKTSPMNKKLFTTLIVFFAAYLMLQWYFKRVDQIGEGENKSIVVAAAKKEISLASPVEVKSSPKETPEAKIDIVSVAKMDSGKSESTTEVNEPSWPEASVEFELVDGKYAVAFGDIVLGVVPEEKRHLKRAFFEPPRSRLWPSPVIPYSIEEDTPNKELILKAIDYFNRETPVRFVPRKDEKESIIFVKAEERCASQLGRTGTHQIVLVSSLCTRGDIIHELMHSLGFVHEHSREDRDQYVEVIWSNIEPDKFMQFAKVPDAWIHEYRGSVFNFDTKSIMLYPPTAFAKIPGETTLKSKGSALKPNSQELSRTDKERVYYLYGY